MASDKQIETLAKKLASKGRDPGHHERLFMATRIANTVRGRAAGVDDIFDLISDAMYHIDLVIFGSGVVKEEDQVDYIKKIQRPFLGLARDLAKAITPISD
jgi:hypothetical protein